MAQSIHRTMRTRRPPRVHIEYEVYVGNALEKKALPFVVGVLGDFSGSPTEPLKKLEERKFIQIDRDNFNDVLAKMTPGLNLRVENTLKGDGSEVAIQLKFKSMDDFSPAAIVQQVEPLRKLLEIRQHLKELQSKADVSPKIEENIEKLLQDPEAIKKLAAELGSKAGSEAPKTEEKS